MPKIYKKIPGIGSGAAGFRPAARARLFTAPDHLLIMQSTFFTEEYKRVFFRDIRYIDVRQTNGQIWMAVVSAILTLLIALLYFVSLPAIATVIFCTPFAVWFILNLYFGPTCKCYISTNVQTLQLPAPGRMKKVATLIAYIRTQAAAFNPVDTSQPAA